jgi:hypothetical protein
MRENRLRGSTTLCVASRRDCGLQTADQTLYPFLVTIAAAVMLERTERGDQMWAQMFSNSACIVQDTNPAALLD